MTDYRITDTRNGKEIQPGGMVTDFCGHTAKLIRVTGDVDHNGNPMIEVEWPEGLRREYSGRTVFSLTVATLPGESGTQTLATSADASTATLEAAPGVGARRSRGDE